jgi:hypothetical protein
VALAEVAAIFKVPMLTTTAFKARLRQGLLWEWHLLNLKEALDEPAEQQLRSRRPSNGRE